MKNQNQNRIGKNSKRAARPAQAKRRSAAARNGKAARRSRQIPASEQPGWKEVAAIDFTGYLDQDCEERIIYKTPEGKFKAAHHSTGQAEVIEDVTREQVTRWLAQCVIPEEFERDFAPPHVAQESHRAPFTEASELARITAHDVIERAMVQRNPEDFVAILAGLRELVAPHPGFTELCHAIEGIERGSNALIAFNAEVDRL